MQQLAADIYLVPIRERAVVLDVARDKYIALGSGLTQAVLGLLRSGNASVDEVPEHLAAARKSLIAKGILADHESKAIPRRPAPPAVPTSTRWPSEYLTSGNRRSVPPPSLAVLLALTQAWLSLKVLPFQRTIRWVSGEGDRLTAKPARHSAQDILDEFFTARPWFPVKPICRIDAIALFLTLRRNGLPADLVFGVTLEPFTAHCWVQCDGHVLNEPSEIVQRYTPIMVA